MNKFFNFLGLAKRSGNILEGYSKCNEERNRRKLFLFIISPDASEATRKKFKNHCKEQNMANKLNALYEEEKYMK